MQAIQVCNSLYSQSCLTMTVAILVWNVQRCQHHNRENSQSAGRLNGNRSALISLPPKFWIRIFRIVPTLAKTKIEKKY